MPAGNPAGYGPQPQISPQMAAALMAGSKHPGHTAPMPPPLELGSVAGLGSVGGMGNMPPTGLPTGAPAISAGNIKPMFPGAPTLNPTGTAGLGQMDPPMPPNANAILGQQLPMAGAPSLRRRR